MKDRLFLKGIGVSAGAVLGRARHYQGLGKLPGPRSITPAEVETELARFRKAVSEADGQLQALVAKVAQESSEASEIFEAHRLILADPAFGEGVEERVKAGLEAPETAVLAVAQEQAAVLRSLDDEYLSQRAQDILDVGARLARVIAGQPTGPGEFPAEPGSIVVAVDLTPSDTAGMNRAHVAAIVLAAGGKTSHTAILSRSLGIPAVVALGDVSAITEGAKLSVDGDQGTVIVNPSLEDERVHAEATRAQAARREELARLRDLPATTTDGHRVALWANISGPADVPLALDAGAEGVGLYRTEFLFIGRSQTPTEAEQFAAYRDVLQGMGGRPVVIRTLDVGGDKDLPYLNLPPEANPFLGYRAIRLCLDEEELFGTQLRALLRSAPHGDLRIMFPMVISVEELLACQKALAQAREELARAGVEVPPVQAGIMVETPAAAVIGDALGKVCDFFSLGTNDLTQYALAVDRINERVSALYDPFHPGVVRLIARTIEHGHLAGIEVGMCGEMAGMALAAPLLVGMGMDELSMAPPDIPVVKEVIRSMSMETAKQAARDALQMGTAQEIRSMLAERFPLAAALAR
ncbi:MAG: phosphoenolpyruvate--protein phosphotransferase [Bacillota bacterium]